MRSYRRLPPITTFAALVTAAAFGAGNPVSLHDLRIARALKPTPQVSYDLRMPNGALTALTIDWARRSAPDPITVDGSFLPRSVEKRVDHMGFQVRRRTPHGNPSSPGFPHDYYFPDYCWRPAAGKIVVWWEWVPSTDDEHGVSIVELTHGQWTAHDFPLLHAVPGVIQTAVCRDYVPELNHAPKGMTLYVANPRDSITARSVRTLA